MKILALSTVTTVLVLALLSSLIDQVHAGPTPLKKQVVQTYIKLAQAKYKDSLETARDLLKKIESFTEQPTESSLSTAKKSWIIARKAYQQTEVFRFGNPAVDDWEGKVNAWPLDEGLIDYVDSKKYGKSDENPFHSANIIANPQLTVSGVTIDSPVITVKTIERLHEIDGIETNVARGYHAIEFLLWGQDLNGFEKGAGERKATDYDLKKCTNSNCERRGQYLRAAVKLLVKDLEAINKMFSRNGKITKSLSKLNPDVVLAKMFTGMGSLSYGELAGERIKLGLMLNDPEEEHDCFSDNTHASHYFDVVGIRNIYLGSFTNTKGKTIKGASLRDLLKSIDSKAEEEISAQFENTYTAFRKLYDQGESGTAYDTLLSPTNKRGKAQLTELVKSLSDLTKTIEQAISVLKLKNIHIESSESLK